MNLSWEVEAYDTRCSSIVVRHPIEVMTAEGNTLKLYFIPGECANSPAEAVTVPENARPWQVNSDAISILTRGRLYVGEARSARTSAVLALRSRSRKAPVLKAVEPAWVQDTLQTWAAQFLRVAQ